MRAYYRNKRTGEIKDVEQDSTEMFELQREIDPHNPALPMWEQTSFAHASAVADRATYGQLDHNDLGKDDEEQLRYREVALADKAIGAEQDPHLQLTPGEIEAGLTPQQKADDLKDMYDEDDRASHASVFEDAADRIAPGERKDNKAKVQAQGMRARAGGSDEREGVDIPKAPKKGSKQGHQPSGPSTASPENPVNAQ